MARSGAFAAMMYAGQAVAQQPPPEQLPSPQMQALQQTVIEMLSRSIDGQARLIEAQREMTELRARIADLQRQLQEFHRPNPPADAR